MNPENLLMLELTYEHLGDLVGEVVFVGGATVEGALPSSPESRDRVDLVVLPRIQALIGD